MKFNQKIWDALVWAIRAYGHETVDALEEYAAECDGTVLVTMHPISQNSKVYTFVPNPIPQY